MEKQKFCYRSSCCICKKTEWKNTLDKPNMVIHCGQPTTIIIIRHSTWSIVNYVLT